MCTFTRLPTPFPFRFPHQELTRGTAPNAHLGPELRIQKATEVLARLLLAQPSAPAVIWVASATRGQPELSVARERHDAASLHLSVTRRYGIPHVDVIGAIGATRSVEWYRSDFLGDLLGHPALVGHILIAELLEHVISTQVLLLLVSARHAP